MRTHVPRVAIALTLVVAASGAARVCVAQVIGGAAGCAPRPVCGVASGATFGVGGSFGNAGFASGYAMQISRAGWCGQSVFAPTCLPCGPSFSACGPWGGWSFGWPGCGIGGWYGGSRFFGAGTVAIGGFGGTFFSGAAVPCVSPWWWGGYPANWLPGCAVTPFGVICSPYGTLLPAGFGPQFGPAGVLPFLSARGPNRPWPRSAWPTGGNAGGVAGRHPATEVFPTRLLASAPRQHGDPRDVAIEPRPRPSPPVATVPGLPRGTDRRAATESGRRRAAALVAAGDRQVRAAAGDAAALRAALATYRRAAAAERDSPDTFIRQAIVHAALGERAAGDEALARAVALDARLGADVVAGDAADPMFTVGRGPRRPALAARGDALITALAAGEADGRPADGLAWLARPWSARWGDGPDGLGGLVAAGR